MLKNAKAHSVLKKMNVILGF